MTRIVASLIFLFLMSPPTHAQIPELRPGDYFKAGLQLMVDSHLSDHLETLAQLAGGSEGDLIQLLNEVAKQCMTDSSESCTFAPKAGKSWPDLIPVLQEKLAAGNFDSVGSLFRCAVNSLEGAKNGEYLDCLKLASYRELDGNRSRS